MQKNIKSFIIGGFVASSLGALAVNIPNTFSAGTPIKASEINANFSALKTAVDALEASPLNLPASLEGTNPTTANALLTVTTKNIGTAIYGISNDPSSSAAGVQGDSSSPGGFGVYGLSRVNGGGTGVYGQGGVGVWGKTTSQTTQGYGVYGESGSGAGYGVFGKAISGTAGVHGETSNANGSGVEGKADGSNAAGVFGVNPSGPGVWGRSTSGNGGYFESNTNSSLFLAGMAPGVLEAQQKGDAPIIIGLGPSDTRKNPAFKLLTDGSAIFKGTVTANGVLLTSDRNAKQNFSSVNALSILEKVVSMPISRWNYKTDVANVTHIGPMAQNFHAAFGLNGSDDTHISSIDAQGVAFAAIQGLNAKLEAENAKLRATLADLEARLSKLEHK